MAGAFAVCISFIAVILVLPMLGLLLIRNEATLARDRSPADRLMDGLGSVGRLDRRSRGALAVPLRRSSASSLFVVFGAAYLQLEPRYRLADQVPDREQALGATGRIDQKLTGANPVHVMIEWKTGTPLYSPGPLEVDRQGARGAGEGGRPRQRLVAGKPAALAARRRATTASRRCRSTSAILPEHLVRRFIAKEGNAVLVTGRLPDVDSSRILPVVEKIDRALDDLRKQIRDFRISVTGLPAVAARNSARMIAQLKEACRSAWPSPPCCSAIAFRSVFVGLVSLLPGLFPVVASGALSVVEGGGLEFASVVALLVVFGLGIDALIHFFNRLSLEERVEPSAELAIRRARVLVGPAIILTTLVLAFGLGVTVFSDLPSLRTVRLRVRDHAAGLADRRPRIPAGD